MGRPNLREWVMNLHSHLKLPLLATALLVSASAWAADYDPPIVVDDVPEFVPVETGSGWYLRGDVGYSFERTEADFSGLPGIDVSRGDFGGGGGVGYHFTDFVRGDLNLAFVARDSFALDDGVDFARLKTESWRGMANVYLDLGTYSGLTPYLGAGLGILYTHNRFEADIAGIGAVDLDDDQSKFAYSLGAGLAYKVAQNWSVDLGYQYTASPDTEYVEVTPAGISVGEGVEFHQAKVGLRYDLW
jgi:opacity protein-like surface antigen